MGRSGDVTEVILVPFKPEHLDTFEPGEAEMSLWPLPNPSALIGKAYSALENGKCYGIGGVFDGRASLFLSDALRLRKFTLHRLVKRALKHFDILDATAWSGSVSCRWLERLGFKFDHLVCTSRCKHALLVYRYDRH